MAKDDLSSGLIFLRLFLLFGLVFSYSGVFLNPFSSLNYFSLSGQLILFSLSFLFCSIVCVLFFVLRVKTDDLSLSLYFNANENRVDERKRGERRRGAVGKRLGRHRRNGRFQDAFERGVEEERHQEINTNNERYYDYFFSVRGDCKDATRISAIVRHSARHGE